MTEYVRIVYHPGVLNNLVILHNLVFFVRLPNHVIDCAKYNEK